MSYSIIDYKRLSNLVADQNYAPHYCHAVMGFDGFIDKVVRVCRGRAAEKSNDQPSWYQTLGEFNAYLSGKDGLSFSVELETTEEKKGGNMPITANALGNLGVTVDCIGALGTTLAINPHFSSMSANCILHPIVEPGWCMAFEFSNSKLMVYDNKQINSLNWQTIKDSLGITAIRQIFEKSDLIGLFNWSEVKYSEDIWAGLSMDVFPFLTDSKARNVFIDLSDCTGRKAEEIFGMATCMSEMARTMRVTLSMNENEIRHLHKVLARKPDERAMDSRRIECYTEMLAALTDEIPDVTMVLHLADSSLSIDSSGKKIFVKNHFVEEPRILIGGGDNYNAGFCMGLLGGEQVRECMALAGATSSYYVQHGQSPTPMALSAYLARLEG